MLNPCYELCYLKHNKEYTKDCDSKCDYARVVKEKELLQEEINKLKAMQDDGKQS